MKKFIAFLAAASLASAAIEGTVKNGTTGRTQGGVSVTLIRLGTGMNTVGTVKSDASGKFRFDAELEAGSPSMLQALHDSVTYSRVLPPGTPAGSIELTVFNASTSQGSSRVSQHMMLVEPTGTEIRVNESIIFSNTGQTTFNSPDGTLRFYSPPDVTAPVRVMVQGPSGMPVQRPAIPAKEANTFAVSYPIRPGDTRIDLQYSVPAKDPGTFKTRILHGGADLKLIAPKGVKIEGEGVTDLGPEPRTQATIYNIASKNFSLAVSGIGSLREAAEAAGVSEGQDDTPSIEESRPRVYQSLYWVLGLAGTMLAIGFAMHYRNT